MCELAPAGEVRGMTTILLTPAKLDPVMVGPWQVTQLVVMPRWLIFELLNLAPLSTGVLAILEPAPTWQVSQAVVIGMWFAGGPTMVRWLVLKPATTLAAWHCAQSALVLGALAWILAKVGITVQSVEVWQSEHCDFPAVEIGMWFVGKTLAEK
jgi:hypothetical protein